MLKKGIAVLLAAIMVLGLAACSDAGENNSTASNATTTTTAATTTTTAATTTTEAETTTTTASDAAYTLEDGKFAVGSLRMDVPEDWTLVTDEGMYMFVPADYPMHPDNLNVVVTLADDAFGDMTQEMMETELSGMYPDLTFHGFEKSTKDGVECVEMAYSVSVDEIEMGIIQYLYNADQLYVVTYTLVSADMTDAMEASANTITIAD